MLPSSASSPTTATGRMRPSRTQPVAARMPSAIGRSNAGPSFRKSAGARLTVMRSGGNGNPALRIAVRTRSRLSRTAESGSPTVVNDGNPGDTSTSTRMSAASTPTRAAEKIRASTSEIVPARACAGQCREWDTVLEFSGHGARAARGKRASSSADNPCG